MKLQSSRLWCAGMLVAVMALAGCGSAPSTDQSAANAPASGGSSGAGKAGSQPAKPSGGGGGLLSALTGSSTKPVTIPEGTAIAVRLDNALTSASNKPGDEFMASVSMPIEVDGKPIIPKGAMVHGKLVNAKESGRLSGVASLSLELSSVEVEGKPYDIQTATITHTGSSHTKRNAGFIGGGAAAGALIGGIAGGGKCAAIGAAAGAGAGTGGAAITGKKDITLGPETALSFKLTAPLTVQVKQ
ncbi:MAG: hypothetical protein HY046_12295 [Acidobacteria bacterium]|nr:hypothetical protein [Acidobacteriota bacterium]